MSSDISLLGAIPPRPILRRSTSAPISKVIASSRRQAISSRVSRRRPYHWDSLAISAPHGRAANPLVGLGEEFLQLCPLLRALADHPGPAGFIGLVVVGLAGGAVELDGLNAGVGLPLRVLGVLLAEDRHRVRFRLL